MHEEEYLLMNTALVANVKCCFFIELFRINSLGPTDDNE